MQKRRDWTKLFWFVWGMILCLGAINTLGRELEVKIKRVAVIHFSSFETARFSLNIIALIKDSLTSHGFEVIPQEQVDNFLIRYRIRREKFLDKAVIRKMGVELKIDALVIASEMLVKGDNPQVFMDAQMIDCRDASVIWAGSLSRSGDDFVSVLGLGKITSLEELTKIVCKKLFQKLPHRIKLENNSLNPFEIIFAKFYPPVVRGNELVRVVVKLNQINAKLQQVKAFVKQREVDLESKDGLLYTGFFRAPSKEGLYYLKIYLIDSRNKIYSVSQIASLRVDNTSPKITLMVRDQYFSPNNDNIKDSLVVIPEIDKEFDLRDWKFEILNSNATVVRSAEDFGDLPDGFIWRGENNRLKSVPEGIYYCRLIVTDKAGNIAVTPEKKIVLDLSPPEIAVFLKQQSKNSLQLAVKEKDISPISEWNITIKDNKDATVCKFWGEKKPPHILICKFKKKILRPLFFTP
ncbi:MAG: hypothetical protein Q9M37_03580 [Desulfonauticus sp.]|nr:hypothetical protein [Desulfonauticus sp.]